MNVMKPSVVALTSGSTCFPVDRPLGALYYNKNTGKMSFEIFVENITMIINIIVGCKLATIGSGSMFSDKYIDQEKNEKFREILFEFLTSSSMVNLIPSDHDDDVSNL